MYQPKSALNKIQFTININFLLVSERGYQPQGFFQVEGVQNPHAKVGKLRPYGSD